MSIDYRALREENKKQGMEKLAARLNKTADAIIAALKAEGVVAKKLAAHPTRVDFDVKGASRVLIEAHYRGGAYYSEGPTGDESLSFKVGNWGSQIITRSAKEDPDLTGVRLARIVATVKADIAHFKQAKDDAQRSQENLDASRKIVDRMTKFAAMTANGLEFNKNDKNGQLVRMMLDVMVTEEEAREAIALLGPLLAKIEARNDGELA